MTAPAPIRVAAVDDHPILLRGLAASLDASPEVDLVSVSPNCADLLAGDLTSIAVVLLDVDLGDGSDPAANVAAVTAAGPRVVLFTSEHRAALVRRALNAGALGLVLKGDPEAHVLEAVASAARGEVYVNSRLALTLVSDPAAAISMSPRAREVLTLLAAGLSWQAVANDLGISVSTARTHLARVISAYEDAGVELRDGPREAIARALSSGAIDNPFRTPRN